MAAVSIQKTIENISREINDAFLQGRDESSSIEMELPRIEEILSLSLNAAFNDQATNDERKKLYHQLALKWHTDVFKQEGPLFNYLKKEGLLKILSQKLSTTYYLLPNHFDFSKTINLLKTVLKKIAKMQVESDRYWNFFKIPIKYIVDNMNSISTYLVANLICLILPIISMLLSTMAIAHSDRHSYITRLLDWITQDKYSEIRVRYENDETRRTLARKMYANEWVEWFLYNAVQPSSCPNTIDEAIALVKRAKSENNRAPSPETIDAEITKEIEEKMTQGVLRLKIMLKAIYAVFTTPLPTGVLPKIGSIVYRALLIPITPLVLALTATIEGLRYFDYNFMLRCVFAVAMPLSMALLGIINAPLYILDTCRFLKEKTSAAVRFMFKGKEEATNMPDLNTSHRTALLYLMGPQGIQVEAKEEVSDLYNHTDVYFDVEDEATNEEVNSLYNNTDVYLDVEDEAANEVQNDVHSQTL